MPDFIIQEKWYLPGKIPKNVHGHHIWFSPGRPIIQLRSESMPQKNGKVREKVQLTPILFHPSLIINEFLTVDHVVGTVDHTDILSFACIELIPTRSTDKIIYSIISHQSVEAGAT